MAATMLIQITLTRVQTVVKILALTLPVHSPRIQIVLLSTRLQQQIFSLKVLMN